MNYSETKVYDKMPEGFSSKVEVAAAYVIANGKLLLLQVGSHKLESGAWGVPAGKLEAHEKPVEGAKRELFEETGIDIDSESSFQSLGQLYISKLEMDFVYHLFGVNLNTQPPVILSMEHCSYKWVSRQETESLTLMNGGKEALDAYCRSAQTALTGRF